MPLLNSSLLKLLRKAAALVLLLGCCAQARADAGQEREYALKAACIFNFCQFITWPADAFDGPSSPIVIGVLGNDSFAALLEGMVAGEVVRGRGIRVSRSRRPDDATSCHLFFVPASEAPRQALILRAIHSRPIVSIGENDAFLSSGGMIVLASVQNKVRLRVNLPAVRAGRISVSSKLLRLADIVQ